MCSTFKLPLAAIVLREADAGRLALDERLPYSDKDMLSHAPVTREHLAEGAMTVRALAETRDEDHAVLAHVGQIPAAFP